MVREETPFGLRVSNIAKKISDRLSLEVDIKRLGEDRLYIYQLQDEWLKELLIDSARSENLIAQIYFQFTPESTPQLGPDELGAGVCIENLGGWQTCEHNMTYIRDFSPENSFLKWWYYESIRVKTGGFTRSYFDPYMRIEVITYSVPVFSRRNESEGALLGVLGIDLAYQDFKSEMNRRLAEDIKSNIETLKKNFELVGEKEALTNQFINVDTLEIVSKEKIIDNLVTKSNDMERVLNLTDRAAQSDANVLLQGETGVGKDYWANYIHSKSSFYRGRLVNINCCALPEGLAESEFFGYAKGAFTGAKGEGKPGYFEVANGGTILLNEIGDLPMHMQVKLLNVIQDKAVIRVGETIPRKINFRLIAATNKDLTKLVQQGKFREDLYYRLNVIPIYIPPLRERKDDIFTLIHFFMAKNAEKYKVEKRLSVELLSRLINYPWPGNIRELENLVERLFITTNSIVLNDEDLPLEYFAANLNGDTLTEPSASPAEDGLAGLSGAEGSELTNQTQSGQRRTLKDLMEEAEKKIIMEKYNQHQSSYKVAKDLGISQSQAYQKIKKYTEK